MTEEAFIERIERLERRSRSGPGAYKLKVRLLACLGYAYIILILALTLGLIFVMIWAAVEIAGTSATAAFNLFKFGLPLGIFVSMILRSLWVRVQPPQGMILKREQAVPLFQMIDRLRAEMNAPAIHRVLLTRELNASVSQVPRLGIFGWQANYLTLGLPLMLTLSPEEFRAVVAHELGHVSGKHGRFGVWVYRVNRTWFQLLYALEMEGQRGAFIFTFFFERYAPYFSAYTFVMRRLHEYEADRAAALVTGARTFCAALLRIELTLALSVRRVELPVSSEYAQDVLHGLVTRPGGRSDVHPSLADRLKRFRQDPFLPEPFEESASDRFLGHKLVSLARSLGY